MSDSRSARDPHSWLPVQPDPPPWDVPLDETTAHIHFQGDRKGKYDDAEGARRLLEEWEDKSWSARLKRFLCLR
jgi:hypothetical protein